MNEQISIYLKDNCETSVENIINRYKELENKKDISKEIDKKKLVMLIKSCDDIIYSEKIRLNLKKPTKLNLNKPNLKNIKNELTTINLNESKSIFMNEWQYIKLLSPFNSKLANLTNHIYTFTNKTYKQINKNLSNLYIICKSCFLNMSSIISKPIVFNYSKLIKITIFFYWKPLNTKYYIRNFYSNFIILHYNKLEKLVNLLSKLFKKSIELELIRIYSPQNDSNILANLIGILSDFTKFRLIHMKLFKVSKTKISKKGFSKNKIPSSLSGLNFKLAGKVLTKKIQRRVKSKIVQKGSLSRDNAEIINTNRFVNKNKRGVFSITIKTGHKINNQLI